MLHSKRANRPLTFEKHLELVLFIYLALCLIPATSQAQRRTTRGAFTVIERKWTSQEILARYTEAAAPVWAEGEMLTFFHREEARAVHVDGSFQVPMQRVENTDLWTVTVEIPNLSRAVIRYRFTTESPGGFFPPAQLEERSFQYWRGPEAPAPPKRVTTLSGRVYEHTLESDTLRESRRITVYLPPEHDADHRYPVIYMADGEGASEYAAILEALTLKSKVPATVLIGIHSGGYRGDKEKVFDPSKDFRSVEYLAGFDQFAPGVDPSRFSAHEHFFLHEVGPWAEEHLGVSTDREQRLLFGFSNGGAFAVSVGIRNPEHFGKILAFAVGWAPALSVPAWDSTTYPRYYLAVGTLDDMFETTSRWAEILKTHGFEYMFRARVSGHDSIMWQEEFGRAVVWGLARN